LFGKNIALIQAHSIKTKKVNFFQMISGFFYNKVKSDDVIYLFSSLAMLIESGVDITSCLKIILHNAKSASFKNIIELLILDLKRGLTFSDALKNHKKVFSTMITNIISVGESSGRLGEVCDLAAKQLQDNLEIRNTIKKAAMLPCITLIFAFFVVLSILIFIVPRFKSLFMDFDKPIPNLTKMVFKISGFMRSWWPLAVLILILGLIFVFKFVFKNTGIKNFNDRLFLKIYYVRHFVLLSNLIFFIQALVMELSSGVRLYNAVLHARLIVSNVILKNKIELVSQYLNKGKSFSSSMELVGSKYFPLEFISVVAIGENSGNLTLMLKRILDLFKCDLQKRINFLVSIFQPVLIIFVGIIIAFILISVYLPIFNLASSI